MACLAIHSSPAPFNVVFFSRNNAISVTQPASSRIASAHLIRSTGAGSVSDSLKYQCLMAHECSETVPLKQLRRMVSAIKLFRMVFCLSSRPVPVPFLPQRFLGGDTRIQRAYPAYIPCICILIAGIFPGGRVFTCQGSAEETHLLPLTPEKTAGRKPLEKKKQRILLCVLKNDQI